jgi:predicted transcriptional regulator
MGTTKANLHVPLPEELHEKLREEARRSGQPATEIAREAISLVLELRRREAIFAEITAYARAVAGSRADLDDDLETAAIEHLLGPEER